MPKVFAAVVLAIGLLVAGIAIGRMTGSGGATDSATATPVSGPAAVDPAKPEPNPVTPETARPRPTRPEPTKPDPVAPSLGTAQGRPRDQAPAKADPAASRAERTERPADAARKAGRVPARLEPPSIDLGHMEPGHAMTSDFEVRNLGTEPLVIEKVLADCRCTTLGHHDGQTIAPGESLQIAARMKYEMSTTGPRVSRVKVLFEGYDEPLEMKIEVELAWAVKSTPAYLALGRAQSGELTIVSIDGKPFRILSVHGAPPDLVGHGPDDPPKSAYKVRWDLSHFDLDTCTDPEGNRLPALFVIETDHPDAPLVDLLVRHVCTRIGSTGGWRTGDPGVVVGRVKAGEPIEVPVDIQWLRSVRGVEAEIESASSDSPQLSHVELVGFERRGLIGTCTVRIIPAETVEGLLYAPITLESPKGSNGVVIIGSVR